MRSLLLAVAMFFAGSVAMADDANPRSTDELFVITFKPGPAWIAGRPMAQQNLRDHAAYHARLVREGRVVAAGGFVGTDGGMAIFRGPDIEAARSVLESDPAIKDGVFVAELRQWRPAYFSDSPLITRKPR
jgi:uncharacterized protein